MLKFFSQANSTGRQAATVRSYLEKHYKLEDMKTEADCVKLAIKALLEVVQSGRKNLEIAVMKRGEPMRVSFLSSWSKNTYFILH